MEEVAKSLKNIFYNASYNSEIIDYRLHYRC